MSFVDLATLTLHRRNELEARINVFISKCDHAVNDIQKLKVQAQNFVLQLNCEPSELKERFLSCMKQLDEFTYLLTDFNLALGQLEENHASSEYTPVHDTAPKPIPSHIGPIQPHVGPINLIDVLSEPTPSTSTACPNLCPSEKPKRIKVPKKDQLLIAFSSSSSSAESMPQTKTEMVTKEIQCELAEGVNALTIKSPSSPPECCNLPAQTLLQVDHVYQATIMSLDGPSFWIITEDIDEVCKLMVEMTEFYKNNRIEMSLDEVSALTYCAFYDDDSDCFYRALFIKIIEQQNALGVEVFLMDTGEVRSSSVADVQPLEPRFCTKPPYARCCHLAGIDFHTYQDEEMTKRQEEFIKEYRATQCRIEVDDNTSESLGVYVILPTGDTLNDLLVAKGFAHPTNNKIDNPSALSRVCLSAPNQYGRLRARRLLAAPHSRTLTARYAPTPHAIRLLNAVVAQEPDVDIFFNNPKAEQNQNHAKQMGPPGLVDSELDITQCPEYEDPVEAVTGYSNRDEADICKHYKGGPEKTCFKGARCTKKHIMKHPDGWTLDRVEVVAKMKKVPLPPPDSWHRVHVTYVCHFDRLYVQFVKEKDAVEDEVPSFGVVLPPASLTSLVRDMNSPAARMAYKPLMLTPAPGEYVAALYPLDNQWYRARVLTVTRADQNVEVVYVDYGNVVWVKEDEIRVLEPRYLSLPEQAVRCVLAGVGARSRQSQQWAQAKLALSSMVQERTLDAHVIGRDYDELIIELYDEEGYSVAEQLAARDMVELTDYSVELDQHLTKRIVAA